MNLLRRGVVTLGAVAVAGAGSLQAQVKVESLTEPEATFPEAFGLVNGLQELPDGRVMIADPLGQALVIADMRAGTADTIGGVGKGPEEYDQPDGLFPLPGGSTLLVDLGNARLTVLSPEGDFGATMPIAQGEPGTGNLQILLPRGTDSQGRLYFRPMGGAMRRLPDSAAVARYDRASGAMDTVTQVKLPELQRNTRGGAGNQAVMISPVPLSPEDAWAVAWDGRVAVARSGDYHVEWIHPDGSVVRGTPVEYEPVRIRRADRDEWAESLNSGITIGIMVENGDRRVSMGRGGGSEPGPDLDSLDWPEHKPAFVSNGVWVAPEGDVWVERHVPAGERVQFDVFGADAELKGRVTLPASRDVVGIGRSSVYVVRTDDLGLQWLELYRRSTT
ncbi:MAG: hypothetical protein JSV86_12985 [Gemmatimonadota bacterium]|nr:MAG: hypothetical protein JSV86_12985 [Gemmatimonadota bacterium]